MRLNLQNKSDCSDNSNRQMPETTFLCSENLANDNDGVCEVDGADPLSDGIGVHDNTQKPTIFPPDSL